MDTVTAGPAEIPALGLGTYPLEGQPCTDVVRDALDIGYRHIDTAELYENERAVGRALHRTDVPRDDIFLTTKLWKTNLAYDDALAAGRASTDRLGVETIDLLLIHAPNPSVPIQETIDAMNDLQREGAVSHIGVSNFSLDRLTDARRASETPIVTNQVKYHPFQDRTALRDYCIEHDIALTAYSPLAKGRVADDGTLRDIGTQYGKSPVQVALRWLVQQRQVCAIPKASSSEHLRANIAVFDFSLTDEEMNRIFELQGGLVGKLRAALGL